MNTTLKAQVEHFLKYYPSTRNSDIELTLMILGGRARYPIKDKRELFELLQFANQESVKRMRAKIQNDERRYLPTDWKVAKERKWNEEQWKRLLGYSTMTPTDHIEKAEQEKHLKDIKNETQPKLFQVRTTNPY